MKLQRTKLGFTLIELLVVITIIGILAVGWVWVFTTQLQWARDTTRIGDMKVVESAIFQLFSDDWEYPSEMGFTWAIKPYISKSLADPKSKPICWGVWASTNTHSTLCAWYYAVWPDDYGLDNAAFKLLINFEKEKNLDKAANISDGWLEDSYLEMYAWSQTVTTSLLELGDAVKFY